MLKVGIEQWISRNSNTSFVRRSWMVHQIEKSGEFSTMDLIQADEYFGEQTRQRELQLRLTTPMACLAFALAALNIGMVDPRRRRSNAYLQALALIVIHYILWSFSKERPLVKNR